MFQPTNVILDSNVKRALLQVVESTQDERERRMRNKIRQEIASPRVRIVSNNQRHALRNHVESAWNNEHVQKRVTSLRENHFFATPEMVTGTLMTCLDVKEWLDDENMVLRKVEATLHIYMENALRLRKLQAKDNKSLFLWEAMKLYMSVMRKEEGPQEVQAR